MDFDLPLKITLVGCQSKWSDPKWKQCQSKWTLLLLLLLILYDYTYVGHYAMCNGEKMKSL